MNLLDKLITLNSRFMSALLPPICVLCRHKAKRTLSLCLPCQNELPILTQHCYRCALFLHGDISTPSLCGSCLANPPPFSHTFALYRYEEPVIHLIKRLKFRHQLSHARILGEIMAKTAQRDWYQDKPLPDLILPVPLHRLRLRERGFNQALEIARPITKRLRIPIDKHSLQRIRHTRPQTGLKAPEREVNLKNAFKTIRDFSGKHIALLDDVVTTSSTINACSQALMDAGAKQIDIWCCARRG